MAGAERETAIIIARNVRHAVAGEICCGVALYRAEDKLFGIMPYEEESNCYIMPS